MEKEQLAVHAFVLMTTHYHLLAETPSGHLGRIMQTLLSCYSRQFNQRHGREGHLWQRRYRALLVQDGEYFLKRACLGGKNDFFEETALWWADSVPLL